MSATTPVRAEAAAPLASGEQVLLIDEKGREYLRSLRPGRRFSFSGGFLDADEVIGKSDGFVARTSSGHRVLIFRPTYSRLIPNLPRKAQVIYPKDTGSILIYGDIYPGAHVVETGVGPGALTLALLRAIGPGGRLVSIERREDHIEMARETIAQFHGEAPNWRTVHAEAAEALAEEKADRVILDLPEPVPVLGAAAEALRPGGVLSCWLPTTVQLAELGAGLRAEKRFVAAETFELLQRHWHVAERSVRPDHRMVAHTGFLTTAWRCADAVEGA
jgi:tRNA (adenine57-N1/adenine58-N1)-methyltransferase